MPNKPQLLHSEQTRQLEKEPFSMANNISDSLKSPRYYVYLLRPEIKKYIPPIVNAIPNTSKGFRFFRQAGFFSNNPAYNPPSPKMIKRIPSKFIFSFLRIHETDISHFHAKKNSYFS